MRTLTLLLFILLGFDLTAQSDSWEMVFEDDVFNVVITENNSFLNTRTSVYRSIDGGTAWNECNWPLGIVRSGTSTSLGLCFDGSRLIVAALDNGYWISTDLGNSFTQTGPTGFGCASISLLPLSDGSVMGTMAGFQRGLWKVPPTPSTSWTRNFQHSGDQGDLQFGQNNNIYCTSYSNNHTGGILESTDNGNSWTWVFNTSYASNPNSFVIDNNELTYFNYLGELVSLDMTNWSITQSIQTPWTNSEGSFILDETGTLFLSNSSGIFSSTDGGQNWDDLTPSSFANTTTYNLKHYENAIYACTSDGLLKLELSTSGCMDPTACNYDANATVDDGSCEAPCNYIVPTYIPEDGLIAWLPFNGNAADESGNGHDGDVDGAILSTDRFDNAESAYFFDGDDRIFPADPTDFPLTERTTSIWMKSQAPVSGGRALLGYGGTGCGSSWLLTYNNQGNQPTALNAFEIQGHCNAFAVAAPLSPSEFQEWHQVVVRTSAAGTDIFIDGFLEAHSSTYVNNTGPGCAVIGATPSTTGACYYQDASNALWHGWLDDVGIWNRALTDDEILTSFLAGTPVHGCTDEAACNYDSEANLDDGSCIPSGCMEEGACNYNAAAECEGEACDYSCCPGPGCCGAGTHWDAAAQTCVITPPSVAPDTECTLLNLQELAEGYQILVAENAELGSMLAECDETYDPLGPCSGEEVITYHDYDYDIVEIGDQCWFAENCRYLPEVSPPTVASYGPVGYVYNYNGDDLSAATQTYEYSVMGAMYNWGATQGWDLCPTGWHIPSEYDFQVLTEAVGGADSAGYFLKSEAHWTSPGGGLDSFGFGALPGGYRSRSYSTFNNFGSSGSYWSFNASGNYQSWALSFSTSDAAPIISVYKVAGLYARCVKD